MKKNIDVQSWSRKAHYNLFKEMDYPHFNICSNVDITLFKDFIKQNNIPFFRAMIFLASKIANSIPEFNYRIQSDDKVVEYDYTHPSFTVMSKPDLFGFCTVDYSEDYTTFSNRTDKEMKILQNEVNIEDAWERDDLIYITSLPWISFTSVTHPVNLSKTDSIPRICWGKFFEENGKIRLPFSVQANHSLMDGVHVGKYFSLLQKTLDNPEESILEITKID